MQSHLPNLFKLSATLTLLGGMFLHASSLITGRERFLQYILTPTSDMLLGLIITVAGVSGWLLWHRVHHPSRRHRLAYGALLTYFTISIPVHLQVFLTQSTAYVSAFPVWYSYPILVIMLLMLIFVSRLNFTIPRTVLS